MSKINIVCFQGLFQRYKEMAEGEIFSFPFQRKAKGGRQYRHFIHILFLQTLIELKLLIKVCVFLGYSYSDHESCVSVAELCPDIYTTGSLCCVYCIQRIKEYHAPSPSKWQLLFLTSIGWNRGGRMSSFVIP